MNTFFWIIVVIGIPVLLGWSWWRRSDVLLRKFNATHHFSVGKYMVGLEKCDRPMENVECVVAPADFIFAKLNGTELGRVPRDSVFEVLVDDKSQLSQRLTATRMVLLGVFALAAPKAKKMKEWCVAVNWTDSRGLSRATVFEFTGSNCEGDANKASNSILRYIDRPAPQIDAKQCPYCAETIKVA